MQIRDFSTSHRRKNTGENDTNLCWLSCVSGSWVSAFCHGSLGQAAVNVISNTFAFPALRRSIGLNSHKHKQASFHQRDKKKIVSNDVISNVIHSPDV